MNDAEVQQPERLGWRRGDEPAALLAREWLLTNGLGGYASGTISGAPSRRHHGLLIASLPAPLGRTLMLNHLVETLRPAEGAAVPLTGHDPPPHEAATPAPSLPEALESFRLVSGRPCWRYERGDVVLEKTMLMPYQQNTTYVRYRLSAAPAPVTLALELMLDVRPHDGPVAGGTAPFRIEEDGDGFRIDPPGERYPALRLRIEGVAPLLVHEARRLELRYRTEQARGYDWRGWLRAPGRFELRLDPGAEAWLVVSTESWEQVRALPGRQALALDDERRQRLLAQARPELRRGVGAELVLAADQFIVKPHARPRDEAVVSAEGDEPRTVVAGYPWFTDWGRDAMISLEGLTLATGRAVEARGIIHIFAHHIRDGLIPNLFPEGRHEGLYHTADATLWFLHAVDRYEAATGDRETRRFLLPKLIDIIDRHVAGTRFGIGVDPTDGLLRQGAPGYQLTWMDAKVGDWVVTPRRGKAVEINALFYNALCLLEGWLREAGNGARASEIAARASTLREAFNRRFWYAEGGYLYDVVDGEAPGGSGRDDASLRPNQLLAIALPHPVLERARWPAVLSVVANRLGTPFGLRSLAPGAPDYQPHYDGDLRARDAAYHQGTVWGWLVGPFVEAWLKTFTDDPHGCDRVLSGLEAELRNACVGNISEIYDAEPPHHPRGCFAQAWSVAEALRALTLVARIP